MRGGEMEECGVKQQKAVSDNILNEKTWIIAKTIVAVQITSLNKKTKYPLPQLFISDKLPPDKLRSGFNRTWRHVLSNQQQKKR